MPPLEDSELAQIAPNFSSMTMRNLAVQRLGFTEDQVKTLSDECGENKISFMTKILVRWRNKNSTNSRQVYHYLLSNYLHDFVQLAE